MKRATKIFCIVAYDVEDNRQRDKISKLLEKYGMRINLSVFECMFTDTQYKKVKEDIERRIDKRTDTLVYYPICVSCFTKIVYQPDRRKSIRTVKII
ncbi:CRISPR-associated endonuclease Cas2 [Dysgonomonas sp. 511]|uniref:CRISPR-associated endonuclease Cas2 n=1 Tax=Dysgonomonas sp. 511 TaxID=2302930 RepID=UPI0013D1389A|nr:CRISPR-associated endonuclease Cas2 [Dysgonomonas sp. 511]NDV80192.1 CRISPR-associated endonuclease Cas2 [Dysgonomonas sp. 511]